MSKPSFERNGQRRLLTKDAFTKGSYQRCPERYHRPLEDQSLFPFGKPREQGLRMWEVRDNYFRWFMEQDWSAKWPRVREYWLRRLSAQNGSGRDRLVMNMARGEEVKPIYQCDLIPSKKGRPPTPADPPPKPVSDPTKAQVALASLRALKQTLST